jgi:hypothetical protein
MIAFQGLWLISGSLQTQFGSVLMRRSVEWIQRLRLLLLRFAAVPRTSHSHNVQRRLRGELDLQTERAACCKQTRGVATIPNPCTWRSAQSIALQSCKDKGMRVQIFPAAGNMSMPHYTQAAIHLSPCTKCALTRNHSFRRMRASWATLTARVPSCVYTLPILIPRWLLKAGESMTYSIHWSALNGAWNHMAWSSEVIN